MENQPKGQKLIKIPGKDHYFYDQKSKIIYWLKKNLSDIEKVSSEVVYDSTDSKTISSSLLKASRIIPIKLKERQSKLKKKKSSNNRLVGDYLDDMLDPNSHFHKSKATAVSSETLESYRTSVRHLKEFFDGFLPDELTPDQLEMQAEGLEYKDPWLDFVHSFQDKNPGYNMFNVTKHFRALCKYMHENGIVKKRPKVFNPFAQKEKVARRKKTQRIYTAEEVMLMDVVCNEDQRLALWLGYDQAFRQDDCVGLEWERIDLGSSPHVVFHGDDNKAGFVGRVPLSDTCTELLRDRRKKSKSAFVFPLKTDESRSMLVQAFEFEKVVRGSGVNHGSHKTLRHTRLTEDFGNPLLDNALVMKIRRVSLSVALEHYVHPTESDFEKFRNTSKANRKQGVKNG